MYRCDDLTAKVLPFSSFVFRFISLKNDSTNQFIRMRSCFIDKHGSFLMNVDECVVALKDRIVTALRCGFNTLSEYNNAEDFGTLPRGSSENEIMMKMELRGFK